MTPKPNLYAVVGMKFRGAVNFVAELPADEPIVLVREPSNRYDGNAIQVWARGRHVGFISKDQNKVLAAFIDNNGSAWVDPDTAEVAAAAVVDSAAVTVKSIAAKLHKGSNEWPLVEV